MRGERQFIPNTPSKATHTYKKTKKTYGIHPLGITDILFNVNLWQFIPPKRRFSFLIAILSSMAIGDTQHPIISVYEEQGS